jgi:hypothetical protein
MKTESRIQPRNTTMLHDIHRCLPRTFILIASSDGIVLVGWLRQARWCTVRHENRNLSAEFGEFERACLKVSREIVKWGSSEEQTTPGSSSGD